MNFEAFKKKYELKKVEENRNTVSKSPMVSVCIQTYQHVNYIKECLDGVIMQKTNFPVEILLGEDASTDGTREICIKYAEKHPDKIRLFLHHRENNIKINGSPTGRFNFSYNLYSARGKYIALCEGDDYWTDPRKLQKQVDFLEENTEFVLCYHSIRFSNNTQHNKFTRKKDKVLKLTDSIKTKQGATLSLVFNKLFLNRNYYNIASGLAIGDWPLEMFLLSKKNGYFLKEEMGCYRKHNNGATHAGKFYINSLKTKILFLKRLLPYLSFKDKLISILYIAIYSLKKIKNELK
jgi:glycosyltransferase involved in cell wall biosynthesis